jgi:hypothetical protein
MIKDDPIMFSAMRLFDNLKLSLLTRRYVMLRSLAMAFVILALFTFGSAHACLLVNNGTNLIYDTARNITWYSPGFTNMTWSEATSWAENLTIGGATGWRLPTALDQKGNYPLYGYNVVGSELGHLYYESLGNVAYGPLANTDLFDNLQPVNYWSSTTTSSFAGNAFVFNFGNGRQGHAAKNLITGFSALAVHSGYVHAPIPGAILLFAPGLVGLAVIRKKFRGKKA